MDKRSENVIDLFDSSGIDSVIDEDAKRQKIVFPGTITASATDTKIGITTEKILYKDDENNINETLSNPTILQFNIIDWNVYNNDKSNNFLTDDAELGQNHVDLMAITMTSGTVVNGTLDLDDFIKFFNRSDLFKNRTMQQLLPSYKNDETTPQDFTNLFKLITLSLVLGLMILITIIGKSYIFTLLKQKNLFKLY